MTPGWQIGICALGVAGLLAACGGQGVQSHRYRGPYVTWRQTREVHAGQSWGQVLRAFRHTPNSYFERAGISQNAQDAIGYYWPIRGTGHGRKLNTGDSLDDDLSFNDSQWPQGTGYLWWEVCMSVGLNGNPVRVTKVSLVSAKVEADTGGDDCPGVQ